jgi:hypothetical protein
MAYMRLTDMRTIQDIDEQLALVVMVRATARAFGTRPTTDFADQLLDERLEIIAAGPCRTVRCGPSGVPYTV